MLIFKESKTLPPRIWAQHNIHTLIFSNEKCVLCVLRINISLQDSDQTKDGVLFPYLVWLEIPNLHSSALTGFKRFYAALCGMTYFSPYTLCLIDAMSYDYRYYIATSKGKAKRNSFFYRQQLRTLHLCHVRITESASFPPYPFGKKNVTHRKLLPKNRFFVEQTWMLRLTLEC